MGLELGLGSFLENIIKAEKSKPSKAVGFPPRVYAITAHTTYYIHIIFFPEFRVRLIFEPSIFDAIFSPKLLILESTCSRVYTVNEKVIFWYQKLPQGVIPEM